MKEICSFPFTQLFLTPSGRITPCCYLAQGEEGEEGEEFYTVGEIQNQTLEEVWNSEKMQTLRRELLSGNPVTCKKQIQASNCNLIRKDLKRDIELKEVMPFPMIRLDMMLNGQCNLECIMCAVWKAPNGRYTTSQFWEEGREKIFPHLKEVDIKGGEPFIQKDFYRLIDEVSAVNSKCVWHITTNAHYKFTEKIRESMDKIRIVRLSVSIDSVDSDNFAMIRKNGELSKVVRTLEDFVEYKNKWYSRICQISCNFVVQEANWHEVPQFYEFCKEKGVVPFYIILTHPEDFSILKKSLEERLHIIDYYVSAMTQHQDKVYNRVLRPLLETFSSFEREQILDKHSAAFSAMEKYDSIADVIE